MSSNTIKIKRGDKIRFNLTIKRNGVPMPRSTIENIRMTVKRNAADPDPGLAQISLTGGGITLLDDTTAKYQYFIDRAVTATFPPGNLSYDCQVDPVDGDTETPILDSIVVSADMTRTYGP
jgi:hypothetical protein